MKVDETVPGGLYLDADGLNYHNAQGQPVSASDVKRLQSEQKAREPGEAQVVELEPEPEEVSLKDSGEKGAAKKAGK